MVGTGICVCIPGRRGHWTVAVWQSPFKPISLCTQSQCYSAYLDFGSDDRNASLIRSVQFKNPSCEEFRSEELSAHSQDSAGLAVPWWAKEQKMRSIVCAKHSLKNIDDMVLCLDITKFFRSESYRLFHGDRSRFPIFLPVFLYPWLSFLCDNDWLCFRRRPCCSTSFVIKEIDHLDAWTVRL